MTQQIVVLLPGPRWMTSQLITWSTRRQALSVGLPGRVGARFERAGGRRRTALQGRLRLQEWRESGAECTSETAAAL